MPFIATNISSSLLACLQVHVRLCFLGTDRRDGQRSKVRRKPTPRSAKFYASDIVVLFEWRRYEDSAFGPWEQATAAIIYPSPFDDRGLPSPITQGSTNALDHFVAYVRGSAGIA